MKKEEASSRERNNVFSLHLDEEDTFDDPITETTLKGYKCRACGMIFPTRRELELHWQRAHASWRRKRRR